MMNEHKGYLLQSDGQFPQNIRIVKQGKGGSIPMVLTGLYTDRTAAKFAIDLYEDTPKRGKKNAKAGANS